MFCSARLPGFGLVNVQGAGAAKTLSSFLQSQSAEFPSVARRERFGGQELNSQRAPKALEFWAAEGAVSLVTACGVIGVFVDSVFAGDWLQPAAAALLARESGTRNIRFNVAWQEKQQKHHNFLDFLQIHF